MSAPPVCDPWGRSKCRIQGGGQVPFVHSRMAQPVPGGTGRWRGRAADVARTYKPFLLMLVRTWRGRGADSACDPRRSALLWPAVASKGHAGITGCRTPTRTCGHGREATPHNNKYSNTVKYIYKYRTNTVHAAKQWDGLLRTRALCLGQRVCVPHVWVAHTVCV